LFASPSGFSRASPCFCRWTFLGAIANTHCKGVRDALRSAASLRTVPAAFKEIEVNGNRLHIEIPCTENSDIPTFAVGPRDDKR
jgi:hypothetical protein